MFQYVSPNTVEQLVSSKSPQTDNLTKHLTSLYGITAPPGNIKYK